MNNISMDDTKMVAMLKESGEVFRCDGVMYKYVTSVRYKGMDGKLCQKGIPGAIGYPVTRRIKVGKGSQKSKKAFVPVCGIGDKIRFYDEDVMEDLFGIGSCRTEHYVERGKVTDIDPSRLSEDANCYYLIECDVSEYATKWWPSTAFKVTERIVKAIPSTGEKTTASDLIKTGDTVWIKEFPESKEECTRLMLVDEMEEHCNQYALVTAGQESEGDWIHIDIDNGEWDWHAQMIRTDTIKTNSKEQAKMTKKSVTVEAGTTGDVQNAMETLMQAMAPKVKIDEETIKEMISEAMAIEVKKLEAKQCKTLEIKLGKHTHKTKGVVHKDVEKIIRVVASAKACDTALNIWLAGPAGSGKTTAAEHVAQAFDLDFYPVSVGQQTTKSDFFGFMSANGGYITSAIRKCYETGGLLLLDEIDAAHPGVLTMLNNLLENSVATFPDGVIKRHKDFICIAAGNTFGRGADRVYVGRNQLDGATLDRFVFIEFHYDEALERTLAKNDAWTTKVQGYRKKADDLKMRVVISPRASIRGAMLLAGGFKTAEVEEMVVFKGLSGDQVKKLQGKS